MRALTGSSARSLRRFSLQAMSVHEGNTLAMIASVLPSGDRTKSDTPVAKLVICLASPPAKARRKTCGLSSTRELRKYRKRPSADQRGVPFDPCSTKVSCWGSPPEVGTLQRLVTERFLARSLRVTVNAAHRPSG